MVFLLLSCLVALSSVIDNANAAVKEDLVVNLPGLQKEPSFKQYSGYLKADTVGDKFLHYWFVESSSNPASDPVVLWLNGGPGCSSDLGLLTEHGPFRIQDDGRTLKYNPYAWNQVANMIYLESPAGVGFSLAKSKDYMTNDTAAARENRIAMQDFFSKFPEYKKHDFYVTGESYGGIYVPTLTGEILDNTDINIKGFAVGNGLSSRKDNDNSLLYFAYYHGLIGDSEWSFLKANCCGKSDTGRCDFTGEHSSSSQCKETLDHLTTLVWNSGLDVYNLYSDCSGGVNTGRSTRYNSASKMFETSYFGWPFSFLKSSKMEMAKRKLIPTEMLQMGPPCLNVTPSVTYFNSPDVRKALHISDLAPKKWTPCSAEVSTLYFFVYNTVAPFYKKALDKKLRVMVYNGDVDMACNFLGDEWFVDSLHLKNPSKRQFWFFKDLDGSKQVAGFVKTFDQLSLVTVKGAGHMVPSDKPIPALEMFINFIQNRPFLV